MNAIWSENDLNGNVNLSIQDKIVGTKDSFKFVTIESLSRVQRISTE